MKCDPGARLRSAEACFFIHFCSLFCRSRDLVCTFVHPGLFLCSVLYYVFLFPFAVQPAFFVSLCCFRFFFTLVIQYHPFSVGFVSLRIPFPYLMFFLLFFFNISQKNFYKILLMRINSTTLCIQWVAAICKEINETLISLMLRETLEVPVALHADFASIPVIEHESQNKLMF